MLLTEALSGIRQRNLTFGFRNWGYVDAASAIRLVLPVCPLYANGSLENSVLLPHPSALEESRVGGKWQAIQKIVQVLARHLEGMYISIPLADLGVIAPSAEGIQTTLERHAELYEEAVDVLRREFPGTSFSFCRYSKVGVLCDLVISPDDECPADLAGLPIEERVAERVKRKLGVTELAYSPELVARTTQEFGEALAVGLLYSYRAPDAVLQTLGNVMVNVERSSSVPSETGRKIERKPSLLFDVARFDLNSWQASAPTIEVSL